MEGFSVAAPPPTTFFFLRAALGAAILDLGCPGTPVGCLSVDSLLVLVASLELLLAPTVVVVRREVGCLSSGGLQSPFLVEGLGMDFAIGFVSREVGAWSLEQAPEAYREKTLIIILLLILLKSSYNLLLRELLI